MLDAYIIDAIRREEQERERQLEEGRRIWLDLPQPPPFDDESASSEEEEERGVVIIPLYPEEDAA